MPCEGHVATVRDVYDLAAPTYVQFVGTEISSATEWTLDRSLLVAFVELMKGRAGSRVADIGCGPGRVAAFMADQGLDVIGLDISQAMLGIARAAHPHVVFEEGRLDALPFESGVLGGAVCWYSIIHTPPDRLGDSFDELARVLVPGGSLLLAFQANAEPRHRADAFGTRLPLTSYRHDLKAVISNLEESGFRISTTVLRAPELEHETTSQAFVIASAPLP